MTTNVKVLDIATDDDPYLKIPAKPVDDYNDPYVQQLVQDMLVTMKAANGIGLAAPQIRVSLRIIVFFLPANRDELNIGVPETILINPNIEILDNTQLLDFEGCLSVPGFRGQVNRYKRIRYYGINEKGEPIDRIAEGWHARLIQHEFDHLNGIIYTELMSKEHKFLTVDEYKSIIASS
eukprot:gene18790-24557_t